MSLRTVAVIQAELTEAYAARLAALKAQSYKLDTGQGSQSVTRDLRAINSTIAILEAELIEAQDPRGGVLAARMRRY